MKAMVVFIGAIASTGVMLDQAARPGIELVVRVEARRLAGTSVPQETVEVIQSQLPADGAEITYITDGQAVRTTTSAPVFGFDDRTVKLVPAGSADTYILNTTDRTYRVVSGSVKPFGSEEPEFHLQPTGRTRTILGHKAREMTGWLRVDAPPFPGERQHFSEVRAEIENWCASTLTVPAAMSRMMDIVQRMAGRSDVLYNRTCPLALQSIVKMSVFPGYEVVWTTQSIRRLSSVPPDSFRIPAEYRQVSNTGTPVRK